eukprot:CAMPEP_0183389570 /NCGR_PEP_ID=MMETSP0370-20130417/5005_1 /TAXON_ID=268820 /ORGANISM="Peridinium aciculiferum, Strain PAER-2" /LENGTH=345 /DNA_ID=CAMNT_0025568845 /DNA_START=49 /DNA_END=1086 /DNA_ORIENTATION=-
MAAEGATNQNLVSIQGRFGTPAPAMLLAVFPSNSKMVEALCLFSAAAKRKPGLPKAFAFEACEPKKPSRLPKANYSDFPEAHFVQRGAGKCRPGKAWMTRALPEDEVLSWTSDDEDEHVQDGGADASAAAPMEWACPRCTFANSLLLPACEVCEHFGPKFSGTESSPVACNSACALSPICPRSDTLRWPSLGAHQSPHHDVASQCSSWLDVAEKENLAESDLDGWSVTSEAASEGLDSWSVASEPPAKELSWAAVAAQNPSSCTVATKPGDRPALQRDQQRLMLARKALAAGKAIGSMESEYETVQQLEERRLYPTTSRGSAQRRRLGKRFSEECVSNEVASLFT